MLNWNPITWTENLDHCCTTLRAQHATGAAVGTAAPKVVVVAEERQRGRRRRGRRRRRNKGGLAVLRGRYKKTKHDIRRVADAGQ